MGFLPDIRRVLARIPKQRQTLFFSATMPPPIATLAKEMLVEPTAIQLERKAAPAVGITQAIYPVAQELKTALLRELLTKSAMRSVLVFTRTKHRANRVTQYLTRNGIPCAAIHGNRSQSQRTQALDQFRAGRIRALVATDIAARGIDVDALSHVVNFDVPGAAEDYIHRVGRTARAEAIGDAFTFVAPTEETTLRDIERALGRKLPRVTLPGFDYQARAAEKLEIPLAERIAAIRERKREERARRAGAAAAPHGAPPPHAETRGARTGPRHEHPHQPRAHDRQQVRRRPERDRRGAEHAPFGSDVRRNGPEHRANDASAARDHRHERRPRAEASATPPGSANGFRPRRSGRGRRRPG
jgi:ATP-dependent RNA helicase RhlE